MGRSTGPVSPGRGGRPPATCFRFFPGLHAVYHQAKLVNDYFRGGWTGEWESTGGPTLYSGGQSTSVDAGTMRRLLLGYLAAGMKVRSSAAPVCLSSPAS